MTNNIQTPEPAHLDFLNAAGWTGADLQPLAGDASTRRYMRITRQGRRAILMIAPPGAESAPCPPEASPSERERLGYNAAARLAGPNLHAFIAIGNALRETGLSAPEIYAADAAQGLALIEDLGDDLFAQIAENAGEQQLYSAAIDVLLAMRKHPPAKPSTGDYLMLDYDKTAFLAETSLLTDWYWPLKKNVETPDDLKAEYLNIFADALETISPPHSMTLRDFHAENLIWLPDRTGPGRVGLIDYQDGLYGAAAYDLVSLLEDARRDVSPELAAMMIDRYCEGAKKIGNFDKDAAGTPLSLFLSAHAGCYVMSARSDIAMVLAAGLGTRMRPLTDNTPKPLIPVAGKALLDYTLDRFAHAGVSRTIINVHYLADQIEAHVSDRATPEIVISDERELLLETGGGLKKARRHFGDEPVFCTNTDAILLDSPEQEACAVLRGAWRGADMDALLLLVPIENTSGYDGKGDFNRSADGRIALRETSTAPFVFTGLQLISPALIDEGPDGPFSTRLLWDLAASRGRLFGALYAGDWMHVGDPEGLALAQARLASEPV
ncbi:N-acetylmuramate/N-acetylglucosamine kinase (MurNAc/GlcNAc kinase) [Durusdinium trenchii]|uniref:N-acetylmuramate/N-acetylglucosamine kinase (MurNAc/GlcNAc kinase) n=1 Tax=Durusdinium trenchii TaxID=1381693 RepID=A0ABP0LU60_9DINO